MAEDQTRDQAPADDSPKSPEEMMQSLFSGTGNGDDLPPPEDVASDADIRRYARPEDAPSPAPAPAAEVDISPVAQRFIDMQNQAATLADLLNKEEIKFEDYQRLLYDAMVQDEGGHWWMIDAENDDWYRHDPVSNQWVIDFPAPLRELERARRDQIDPDATMTQPGDGYDLPPRYGGAQAGDPIYDERGVKVGNMPPTKDELVYRARVRRLRRRDTRASSRPWKPKRYDLTSPAPAAQPAAAGVIPRAIDADFRLAAIADRRRNAA